MRILVASLTASLAILSGCASPGAEKFACALGAFGAAVNNQPEPSCVQEIRSQQAALTPPRQTPTTTPQELDETTKVLVEQVKAKGFQISMQLYLISQLKKEPTLTDSELKWLVEIEDLFLEAVDIYRRARIEMLISDKNVGDRDAEIRRFAYFESAKTFNAATKKYEKAMRDFDTLLTRVEVQKKKGSSNPVPTTAP